MKHKVGDRVRIKSRDWWDAQPKNNAGSVDCGEDNFTINMTCYCGQVATISSCEDGFYFLNGIRHNWTDEMFEDEAPHPSEDLLKDIANVIKTHNMGVQVSEEDGKLIIEPLEEKKENDLPIDTPCMVAAELANEPCYNFLLRYYAGNRRVFTSGLISCNSKGDISYDIIIPWDKFNPNDIEESLKHNIVKS